MRYTDPNQVCTVCGKKSVDLHHWKSRGSGGSDDESNLLPVCRKHHSELHQIGSKTFADKYKQVKMWLRLNGWQLDPVLLRWTNSHLDHKSSQESED